MAYNEASTSSTSGRNLGFSAVQKTMSDNDAFATLNSAIKDSQPEPPMSPVSPKKPQRKCFKKASLNSIQNSEVESARLSPAPSITSAHTASNSRLKSLSIARSFPTDSFTKKVKEKSLTYVNYLNAFSNSLTIHPPAKRGTKPTAGSSRSPIDDEVGFYCNRITEIDFETGGSKIGSVIPYLPDFDRDRCAHIDSFCPFSKRDGYAFCEKHLLDDKGLPFVPCAFQRTESNPCPYPARMPPGAGGKNRPQRSKEALCALHIEKCMQEVHDHMKSSANSVLSTMDDLAQFNINPDKGLPPTNSPDMLDDLAEAQTRDNLETYLRATAKDTYATGSSSENSVVEDRDLNLFTSRTLDTDDEMDSEDDEPIKYAHTFTVEELTRILRLKMAKQKELLAFEIKLQEYKLKDARARYLEDVSPEKIFMPSVSLQARHDPQSLKAYRSLRTMMRFNRKRPRFSFTHTRKPSIKLKNSGKLPESISRCLHSEMGAQGKVVKCRQYSLPFSRHCLSHILEDQYQYLYKRCASDVPKQCYNPVLKNMGIKYCCLHTDMNSVPSGPNLDESQTISSSSEGEIESINSTVVSTSLPTPTVVVPEVPAPRPKRKYVRRNPSTPRVKKSSASRKSRTTAEAQMTKLNVDSANQNVNSPEIVVEGTSTSPTV